jgi:hypothetical protein
VGLPLPPEPVRCRRRTSGLDIAYDALEFIAQTGAFYVRELPGGLTDKERVALVEALLSVGGLCVAP